MYTLIACHESRGSAPLSSRQIRHRDVLQRAPASTRVRTQHRPVCRRAAGDVRIAASNASNCSSAHDFIWKNRARPYDLIVYQLGNAPCHDYMWAYLVRYPGLVVLHDGQLHHARGRMLLQRRQQPRREDYRREFRFNHPDANPDCSGARRCRLAGIADLLVADAAHRRRVEPACSRA